MVSATYRIDPQKKLVVILPSEAAGPQDIARVFDEVLSDAQFHHSFQFISDRRGVSREPSSEYVRQAVDVIRRYSASFGNRKWAILIDPDQPAMFGMGRIAEAVSEYAGIDLKLFTDCRQAVAWLHAAP